MTHTDDRDDWLQQAIASDYFSAPTADQDVRDYLAGPRSQARAIGKASLDIERVILVGSGGSLACLITAAYLLESLSGRRVDVIPALELRWRAPVNLDRSLVIFNSWSGKNSDVLDALSYALEHGARTAAIVHKADSPLAQKCDDLIRYDGRAIYEVPILAAIDLVLAMDDQPDRVAVWDKAVAELPDALGRAYREGRELANAHCDAFDSTEMIFVLGAGPFSSLGLKLANVLMENDRIGAAFYDASEFRHGAVEAFERFRPEVLVLTGSDASRPLADRVTAFCESNGARTRVCDAQGFGLTSSLLEALVGNVLTQWFVVELARRRGIDDLDVRLFMGGGKLSGGQWP